MSLFARWSSEHEPAPCMTMVSAPVVATRDRWDSKTMVLRAWTRLEHVFCVARRSCFPMTKTARTSFSSSSILLSFSLVRSLFLPDLKKSGFISTRGTIWQASACRLCAIPTCPHPWSSVGATEIASDTEEVFLRIASSSLFVVVMVASKDSYRAFRRDRSGRSAGDVRFPVFCARKGAHRVPPRESTRQIPAATTLLPTPDMVPRTAMLFE
mmetsp:Transcript_6826/g.19749  ORF Transcript_6826/g.19749 Transcript_6826/m.19749 type:complete len:212 (+) Transcript_6826:1447-2082(+)